MTSLPAIYLTFDVPPDTESLAGQFGIHVKVVVAPDHPAREALEPDEVYEVTATELPSGQAFSANHFYTALGSFLKAFEQRVVHFITIGEVASGEDQPRFCEEFYRRFLDLDSMESPSFTLEANRAYDLWPSSVPGPHHLSAFWPPVRLTDDLVGGTPPELFHYQRDFIGKTWGEIPEELYDYHNDVFTLMDLETLSHLFPGYLLHCHRSSGSMANQMLRFFVGGNAFLQLLKLLTAPQRAFTVQAVTFIMQDCRDDEELAWRNIRGSEEMKALLAGS